MKNKILRRLILYFVTSFGIFALVIGTLFTILFSQHNVHVHHAELGRRAANIADSLAELIAEDTAVNRRGRRCMQTTMGSGMMGTMAFLRFIEDIAMSDVWVIDSDSEQIVFGGRQIGLHYRDLPTDSEDIVQQALNGDVAFCEAYNRFWNRPTITVAAPIIMHDGAIAGAVLLHSQVASVHQATGNGLTLLAYSMGIGVLVSAFVAVILSKRFTQPLNRIKKAALQISDGEYQVKTGVMQNDEIGELAVIMDDMANKLNRASQERETLDKLRKDFVANISHELRTPITVIRGSLEALIDGVVSDAAKVKEFHTEMFDECKYLERLVSDLLDLSRLQNADFAIERQLIDLKAIAEDVTRTMSRVAKQKDVRLALDYVGDSFICAGDYGRLRQMLIIVLDNAIKFSPQGGTVFIHLMAKDSTVHISIRDEGQGIAPDDLPHIFERFYKQRSEQNKAGTGLGLAIAKQIADRHGAVTTASNHAGGGAEFTFEIPG